MKREKLLLLVLVLMLCYATGYGQNINFADANVKAICVAHWDTNGDGELSKEEAAAVTTLNPGGQYYGSVFTGQDITSFDELQYFTSLTEIGEYCFYNCSNLTSIVIPEGVKIIRSYAFHEYCEKLSSVTLPKSLETIENKAFYRLKNLTAIYISDLAAWCNIDFKDEPSNFHDWNTECSNPLHYAKHLYLNGREIKNLEIPNGVKNFGTAFRLCTSFTSVTIPESVTSITSYAFDGCSSMDGKTNAR